jgi:hypothetical protein
VANKTEVRVMYRLTHTTAVREDTYHNATLSFNASMAIVYAEHEQVFYPIHSVLRLTEKKDGK